MAHRHCFVVTKMDTEGRAPVSVGLCRPSNKYLSTWLGANQSHFQCLLHPSSIDPRPTRRSLAAITRARAAISSQAADTMPGFEMGADLRYSLDHHLRIAAAPLAARSYLASYGGDHHHSRDYGCVQVLSREQESREGNGAGAKTGTGGRCVRWKYNARHSG